MPHAGVTTCGLGQIIELLCCPKCGADLCLEDQGIVCGGCLHRFPVTESIPQLFWSNDWPSDKRDVTEAIQSFYEKTPFPNYDDTDDVGTLLDRARRGYFARLLDEQIPFGSLVVECGCGTGQLSNFLSVGNRTVLGTDICMNSLRLAQAFKDRHGLKRAHFLQMNLFQPVLKPGRFDLVISNGVLHHTADPFLGFRSICRLLKPKGHIIIGLYHKYGRLLTDLRRMLFQVNRDAFIWLDARLSNPRTGETRRNTWFADQYLNPHESKHTVSEVLGWFAQTGIQFVKSIPKTKLGASFSENEPLFQYEDPGTNAERWLKEVMMTLTNSGDSGFFVVIGRKVGE